MCHARVRRTERGLLVLLEQHQVVGDHVGHVQVHDPVHQVEAHEAHREHDARVLVYVRGRHAQELADVL